MPNKFEVNILSSQEVHTLPGAWPLAQLRELLELADMDDVGQIDDADLLDMAIMALQDLGNQKAGELVLEVVFGDSMRPGVRQNLVDDLQDDAPWEDFANVDQQRGLFLSVVMLQQAFPNRYGVPDAIRLNFSVHADTSGGKDVLDSANPAWLIRLLARGMSETDVLHRLYEKELAGGPFPDAAGLVWHCAQTREDRLATFDLIAPKMWIEPLSRGMVFQASV